MIRKLYGILAGLAVAGATMFQANGCTANIQISGLDSLLGGSDLSQVIGVGDDDTGYGDEWFAGEGDFGNVGYSEWF
jgi:hypothetical protein